MAERLSEEDVTKIAREVLRQLGVRTGAEMTSAERALAVALMKADKLDRIELVARKVFAEVGGAMSIVVTPGVSGFDALVQYMNKRVDVGHGETFTDALADMFQETA